ncbi:hypothetical protein BU15DRAFT_70327 [Melanogaster broomeanus]|nr:hypothetical protein BU15DRAFT_70327 [Melanogaster broomeanus]
MPPDKKRVKIRNTKVNEEVQALGSRNSCLVDMPLDIVMESRWISSICPELAKPCRAFLLNRNKCLPSWKTAFSNVKGLPACPDYISEPAYAHLVFVPLCHGCLAPCDAIKWELRLRCCSNCLPIMTITQTRGNPCLLDTCTLFLPSASMQYRLYDDGLEFDLEYFYHTYSVSDCKSWFESFKHPGGLSQHELENLRSLAQRIKQHSILCRDWERKMLEGRVESYRVIFEERRISILRRLKRRAIFGRLPQVRKLEPLTPAEWTEIRPQLDEFLQPQKAECIEKSRLDARHRFLLLSNIVQHPQQRFANDTSLKVRPHGIDVCMLPAVQKMFERGPKTELNMADLTYKPKLVLHKLVKRWSANAVDEVKKLARAELGLSPRVDPSRRISVIFQCKACCKMLRFDEALSHPHLYKSTLDHLRTATRKRSDKASETPSYEQLARDRYLCYPRDCNVLRPDVTVFRRINDLVEMIGYTPDTVTMDDLRHSGIKVTCGRCRQSSQRVMDIPTAFDHCMKAHLKTSGMLFWTVVESV